MTFVINPYRFAAAGQSFGYASRNFGAYNADYFVDIFNSETVATAYQSIGNSNAYTLAAWIKDDDGGSDTSTTWYPGRVIIELRQETSASSMKAPFSFGVTGSAGSAKSLVFGRTTGYANTDEKVTGSTTDLGQTPNVWRHVCAVIDGDNWELFVDGASDGSGTFAIATGDCSVSTASSNMQIGIRSRDGGQKDVNGFGGLIADVRVYNTALSSGDVLTLAGGTDVSTGLIGWWLTNTDDVLDYAGTNDGTSNSDTYSTDGPLD